MGNENNIKKVLDEQGMSAAEAKDYLDYMEFKEATSGQLVQKFM